LKNWVFIDESGFNINMRPSTIRSTCGASAIITTPLTKALSHSVLGAISLFDALNIGMGIPQSPKKENLKAISKEKQVDQIKQFLKELR
jgi:hypothetical protein